MPVSSDSDNRSGLRGYVESAPDAIVVADPATRTIVDANRTAEEFFGRPREELLSMHILGLHPSGESERYTQLFDEHFQNQPAVISRFEDGSPVFAVTADGRHVPVEINAWAVEDGDSTLFQGVFRDVSERLQREGELQRQNERLEEFASIVSHDLRNPLNVAEGWATFLQEERGSDDFEPLIDALGRMEAIIEDTLTLARNGERVGETSAIEGSTLVGSSWRMVDTGAATLEIADEFTIRGDRTRLRRVFENLFRNAVEHGDDVTVRVGLADERTVYVEDDGPGIPEDDRKAVFDPSYSSTTDGTGFGLTIVHRIAEAHGWDVQVTQSGDGGARFEFLGVDITK